MSSRIDDLSQRQAARIAGSARFLLHNYQDVSSFFLLLVAVLAIAGEFSLTGWLLLRGGKEPVHSALARHAYEG
jgi:hypothetical protein